MKYFKHDIDACQNLKLWKLIKTHGVSGYGIWWALLEALYSAEDRGFQILADELWLERFADKLRLADHSPLLSLSETKNQRQLLKLTWGLGLWLYF